MTNVQLVNNRSELGAFVYAKNGQAIPVDDDLVCPVSLEIMRDPVLPPCGHSFDRSYGTNLNWIQTKGCFVCRAVAKLEELKFDHKKWKRIKPLLDKELPQTWHEKLQAVFARLKIASKSFYPIILNWTPNMVDSLRDIAKPVHDRCFDIHIGRCKHMGLALLKSEWRFARTVIFSVASLVRDIVLSLLYFIGWLFSAKHTATLAKRISLIVNTSLNLVGICYEQLANKRMYMAGQIAESVEFVNHLEELERGFMGFCEHIEKEMNLRLVEAREGFYLAYSSNGGSF